MPSAHPAQPSIAGPLVFVSIIAATMIIGLIRNRRDSGISPETPVRMRLPTHATLRMLGHGYAGTALRGMLDINHAPLFRSGVAMWCKVEIPQGAANVPPVSFDIRDKQGAPFPFQFAWIRDGAYVFLPTGYSRVPKGLTLSARQGKEIIGHADLPKLPPAVKAPTPALTPPWPGLQAVRISTPGIPPRIVSLLVKGTPLHPGDSITGHCVGSSSSADEPCNDLGFGINPQPAPVDLGLKFPQETRCVYLDVVETHRIPYKRPPGRPPAAPGVMSTAVLREAVISVPLDRSEPASLEERSRVPTTYPFGAGALGMHAGAFRPGVPKPGPANAAPPLPPHARRR